MESYKIPLVPGPVAISTEVLAAYQSNYGSSDMESDFFDLYRRCEQGLKTLLATKNDIPILCGEGMLALWGAMKSVIRPGDKVLAVATGVFGYGFADMARQLGAEVETVGFGYDDIADVEQVRAAAKRFRPRLVTMVHCETPSGTLNPLAEIGAICAEINALYYVDFVASAGGTPVLVDEWKIDLGLLGSQKALSLMPDLSMVSISSRAWEAIEATGYVGYDALAPWKRAIDEQYMPYTHNWHALAGLKVSLDMLMAEGLDAAYRRHAEVAHFCRERLHAMGIELLPKREEISAPTVTAAKIPTGLDWPTLDRKLRAEGMVVGGSYGPLADKVFRIGHMGTQADHALVARGMDVLEGVLAATPR
ncbi:MAG: alanine--glyoxylate aminotransferase family protein [Caldilineaceae bacterium]|nr:alanine--glyoxylate aminotransferase family protein [Caldilineaceae bacterium]